MLKKIIIGISLLALSVIGLSVADAGAYHDWNGYHWARTTPSFNLKLGDNVNGVWDGHLANAVADWNPSPYLDLTVVPSNVKPRTCKPTAGRVEVCNAKYGRNGWLGLAQIWISGDHITQGTVKVNDTYAMSSAEKQMVMCQEIAHTFGLDHQDEAFDNPNLGTCMDYTANVLGPPSNVSPNQHDFEEIASLYGHADTTTTVGQDTKVVTFIIPVDGHRHSH